MTQKKWRRYRTDAIQLGVVENQTYIKKHTTSHLHTPLCLGDLWEWLGNRLQLVNQHRFMTSRVMPHVKTRWYMWIDRAWKAIRDSLGNGGKTSSRTCSGEHSSRMWRGEMAPNRHTDGYKLCCLPKSYCQPVLLRVRKSLETHSWWWYLCYAVAISERSTIYRWPPTCWNPSFLST